MGSWHWEIASDIFTWSKELYRIFGRDHRRLPPQFAEHRELYTAESWTRLQSAVLHAIAQGTPYKLRLDFHRPDGTLGLLEACGAVERAEDGTITGLHGIAQDVTEREQLLREVESQRAALCLVARDLAAANKRSMQFISLLGHELRNALAPIASGMEVIRRGTSPDSVDRSNAMIDRQLRQAGRLIEDLFDLRRIESGELSLVKAEISVASVVEAAIDACLPLIRKVGLLLVVDGGDADCRVIGDFDRLTQVFTNLLANAAKFTPAGSIRVGLRQVGNHAEISVVDDGIGIDPGDLKSIFALFAKAAGSGRNHTAGIGVGLHLVKQLVELHGGTVTARSDGLGRGSTFTVRLPLAPDGI